MRTMKKYVVLVVVLAITNVATADDPFTIVALPDTQNYVNSTANAPLFTQQTQWIADQIQVAGNPRNIQFVSHLGDLVSTGTNLTQWQRADASMDVLDGVVKYSALPGNHDYASTGDKITGTVNYVSNFGPQRYAAYPWYGGADPSGNNSYQRVTAGGYDFIHLALEWQPNANLPFRDPSPIEWAQSVINANPDTPVILSTHEHIDDDPAGRSPSGEATWNQLIANNDQIFMVLNGHFHSVGGTNDGEYHQVSTNNAGRPVIEVLQDYQDYANGGNGWLRLINFDIPNNQIEFETYSPVLDQFQTETVAQVGQFASQFQLPIDFANRLQPVILPPLPEPDLIIQQGLAGYTGTSDKELRSVGGDTVNGQATLVSVDGDDGSPGLQPTQGLVKFANLIGPGAGQLSGDRPLEQVLLVLEVENTGSGFQVHEMLTSWDETSTWASLVGGVQPDGVEAATMALASVGADNSSSNVSLGALTVDVTSTIQGYLDGSLDNHGWALLPFTNGTNGVDFFSSENPVAGLRPRLEIFFEVTCDLNLDGICDGVDIDMLVQEIVAGTNDDDFDMNGDGLVTRDDITDAAEGWLRQAGEENLGVGLAYLEGDTDLDGTVDGEDFIDWNNNKFTSTGAWTLGDFNADGVTDGVDFVAWNNNKFISAERLVPEVVVGWRSLLAILALMGGLRCEKA